MPGNLMFLFQYIFRIHNSELSNTISFHYCGKFLLTSLTLKVHSHFKKISIVILKYELKEKNLSEKYELTLPNTLYETRVTLTPKPDRNIVINKLQTNVCHEDRHKNP